MLGCFSVLTLIYTLTLTSPYLNHKQEMNDKLGGVQHPLKTCLTLCEGCGNSSLFGYIMTMDARPHTPAVHPIGVPLQTNCKPSPMPHVHADCMVKFPWSLQTLCMAEHLVHCPMARMDSTLYRLNTKFKNSSFQQHEINFPGEAGQGDTPIIDTHGPTL